MKGLVGMLDRFNRRHPWNHNDAFHPWILSRLPSRRNFAIDIGCGRGDLLALLAEQFEHVEGNDIDSHMRTVALKRCAGLENVGVNGLQLSEQPNDANLITMVAVLHHLELTYALHHVAQKMAPGGKFLCIGLARPFSVSDYLWEIACTLTNPLIGFVRHPWPATYKRNATAPPMRDPQMTLGEIRSAVQSYLPGARIRRHLGFRYTIEWTKP